MIQAKKNKVAPVSVFFLLYISRIVVSLTSAQLVTTGKMKTDILLSISVSALTTLLVALPAVLCYIKHKNPFDVKWISVLYSVYFIFLAAVNISRFSYFASTTLNPDSQAWVFSAILTVCAFYAAYLGIESLARFSAFGFVLLVLTVIAAVLLNSGNFQLLNYYPLISNDAQTVAKNIMYMTSSSSESVIFLCLCKKVNGSAVKPYLWSVAAAFLTIFILFFTVIGIMGDGAALNAFPLYTMFQMAEIGMIERIDVFYISLWIFGIFIKSVLLIYCSSTVALKMKSKTKCFVSALAAFALSVYFTEFVPVSNVKQLVYIIPFAVFCIVVPIATLIFKKRNYGDELVEKF